MYDDGTCPVCLDEPLYPVSLPCKHVHCFLCVKGLLGSAAKEKAKCGACNKVLNKSILEEPKQLKRSKSDLKNADAGFECWFYQDGEDWWKYDKRQEYPDENL